MDTRSYADSAAAWYCDHACGPRTLMHDSSTACNVGRAGRSRPMRGWSIGTSGWMRWVVEQAGTTPVGPASRCWSEGLGQKRAAPGGAATILITLLGSLPNDVPAAVRRLHVRAAGFVPSVSDVIAAVRRNHIERTVFSRIVS